jgi:peroxiredoxin (alkyl hydroperoxide reductase subunit C)
MKTVGDKLSPFVVTGVLKDAFFDITEKSFEGKWKVIVYYPKDFTFVCPTEIVAYDKLTGDFADRDAVLLTGSTDNEYCKVAWQSAHPDLISIPSGCKPHDYAARSFQDQTQLEYLYLRGKPNGGHFYR